MNLKVLLQNNNLKLLIQSNNELVDCVINKAVDKIPEVVSNCISYAKLLGLHYGHSIFLRKCHNSYLSHTKNGVNIIDMEKSYKAIIKTINILSSMIKLDVKIFICSRISLNIDNKNIYISNKWMPGTLTNSKYVICNYKNFYIKKIGLILNLLASPHPVISREVDLNNDIRKSKIYLLSCVDTDIDTGNDNSFLVNILLNNESPYFNFVVSNLISYIFKINTPN